MTNRSAALFDVTSLPCPPPAGALDDDPRAWAFWAAAVPFLNGPGPCGLDAAPDEAMRAVAAAAVRLSHESGEDRVYVHGPTLLTLFDLFGPARMPGGSRWDLVGDGPTSTALWVDPPMPAGLRNEGCELFVHLDAACGEYDGDARPLVRATLLQVGSALWAADAKADDDGLLVTVCDVCADRPLWAGGPTVVAAARYAAVCARITATSRPVAVHRAVGAAVALDRDVPTVACGTARLVDVHAARLAAVWQDTQPAAAARGHLVVLTGDDAARDDAARVDVPCAAPAAGCGARDRVVELMWTAGGTLDPSTGRVHALVDAATRTRVRAAAGSAVRVATTCGPVDRATAIRTLQVLGGAAPTDDALDAALAVI